MSGVSVPPGYGDQFHVKPFYDPPVKPGLDLEEMKQERMAKWFAKQRLELPEPRQGTFKRRGWQLLEDEESPF